MSDSVRPHQGDDGPAVSSAGLRAIVGIASELILCSNRVELHQKAVELARERLGVERAGIHVKDGDVFRGTFGTNRRGEVVDESAVSYPVNESCGPSRPVKREKGQPLGEVHHDIAHSEWNGSAYVTIGRGWRGVTPIQGRNRLYGLFLNDAAITGSPADPATQELIAVYCSLLGAIVERLRALEDVMQAERMAAVGTLAGGIAHEFNNLHAIVLGNLDLTLELDDVAPQVRTRLESAREAAARAAATSRDLLTFSRRQESCKRSVLLSRVAEDTLRIVTGEFESEGIDVEFAAKGNVRVTADPVLLGQVVMHLLINARHAMLDVAVKRLRLSVGGDGERAFLRVEDSGVGIKPADMPKLFTPFFTTKGGYAEMNSSLAQVRGTGLGLSVSDTIVRDHGGRISVTSAPRAGATFTVWLPLAEAPRGETSRREPAVEPVSGARIVVIDDEPGVRRLAEEALRTQGYDVASTDDGAEALRMLQAERFDLAIVDLQMPKMSGAEFLRRMRQLDLPHGPAALVSTGREAPAGALDATALGVFAVLEKPWRLGDLYRNVASAILDARRSADR